MAKVTTPVPGFSGRVAGVSFEDGVGETDDEAALAYFDRQGYGVDGVSVDDAEDDEQEIEAEVPVFGNELENPPAPEGRDAADPRNDMVPVGGVKGDGTIVAGRAKGKRVSKTQPAPTPEPGSVVAGVQETGDPTTQSANPSAPNPPDAVVPQAPVTTDVTTGETVPTNLPADDDASSAAPAADESKLKSGTDTTLADTNVSPTVPADVTTDTTTDTSKKGA